MARPRRRPGRFRIVVTGVVGGIQVPAVTFLSHLVGWPVAVGGAALISVPYLAGLRNPFDDREKPPLLLFGALYPFFAWWVACLVFATLWPLAFLVSHAFSLPFNSVLGVSGALGLVGGVLATWREPAVKKVDVAIKGLPSALDGYRIAQISDIHCGSYTPATKIATWVERMNELGADLIAVTGDLITSGDRHTEAVAGALGGLRARDGVYACMGNHDYFCDAERFVKLLESNGLTMLRNRGITLDRVPLHVAGVDDTWTGRNDTQRALAGRKEGVPTLLLAHDPNLFKGAVEHQVELTLSGHTHGGQLAISRRWTLARLITEFTAGLYMRGESQLYVNRGAGTTGPPVRLGAPAELTLLTLRKAA
jgi:predicted MPP superfamily phosphohydrolase